MGGKVALKYVEAAIRKGVDIPANTWILDSLPGPYAEELLVNSTVSHVLATLSSLPPVFESRQWVVNELKQKGVSNEIALWLGTSVITTEDGNKHTWAFNLKTCKDLYMDFRQLDMWPVLNVYPPQKCIHYVRAGREPQWTDSVIERFRHAPVNVKLHTMPNVGHWIHSEDLAGLLRLMKKESC
jgi:pimeloyl-ACP methyl ester carboxylesterase